MSQQQPIDFIDVLAIIPARGGSKGVPRKNIRDLHGKPLLVYTIETARLSKKIQHIAISTDDTEIAGVAAKHNVAVVSRPPELARDTSSMMPAIIQATDQITQGKGHPRVVVVLQPTSPFRKPDDIDNAIERILKQEADVITCLTPVHKHPFWMKVIDQGYVAPFMNVISPAIRRQDLPPAYALNGSIFALNSSALEARRGMDASFATQLPGEKIGALTLDGAEALEIDTEFDFFTAEALMKSIKS